MAEGGRFGADNVEIDVNKLTTEMQSMVFSNNFSIYPRECCIFRVPNILSRHNPEAYKPNAFSIGPFYYKKEGFQQGQKIKLKYLKGLLSRGPNVPNLQLLQRLNRAISEIREAARNCYAGDIGVNDDDFVKLLVIDGCFLIELFRKNLDSKLRDQDDPIFAMACQIQFLSHDLILLENQIPWLVLDSLFSIIMEEHDLKHPKSWLAELAIHFLSVQSCFGPVDTNGIQELATKISGKHILDLLRNSMVLNFSIMDGPQLEWKRMPSATTLTEAGIKFKKGGGPSSASPSESFLCIEFRKGGSPSPSEFFLDIKFEGGVLEIPPLVIHELTEPVFRNLIALEQCLPNCKAIVTSYATLLDNLINTTKDMEILCKHGIVYNWLNVDDATKVFNQLYDDTCVRDFYYTTVNNQVYEYCQRRCPKYRTVLMHDYFRHPWALISVIAATILLILAFMQTLYTIIYK